MNGTALQRRAVLPQCPGCHSGKTLTTAEGVNGNGQVSTKESPQDSLGLPLETSAQGAQQLCFWGGRGKQGPQADSPGVLHPVVGVRTCGHTLFYPPPSLLLAGLSLLFQKQALDPDWGSCPWFPSFVSSLPTEAPGSEGLRPCPSAPACRPL